MRLSDLDDPRPPGPPDDLLHRLQAGQRARRRHAALGALGALALGGIALLRPGADGTAPADVAVATSVDPSTSASTSSSGGTLPVGDQQLAVMWVPDDYAPSSSIRHGVPQTDVVHGWSSPDGRTIVVALLQPGIDGALLHPTVVTGADGRSYELGSDPLGTRAARWKADAHRTVIVIAPSLSDDELVSVLDATELVAP